MLILDVADLYDVEVQGLSVATCNDQSCYDGQTETTPASSSYCDTTPGLTISTPLGDVLTTGVAPNGCIRYLPDRSNYHGVTGTPSVFGSGWRIGQDDPGKPRLIPNCIGNLPCMEGYDSEGVADANATVEFPPADYITSGILSGPFSIFVLAKPEQSSTTQCFLGHATYCLGLTSSGALYFRRDTHTFSTPLPITEFDQWILLEAHRDGSNNISFFLNGEKIAEDTSSGGFAIGYILSSFKGNLNVTGQLMSVYVYGRYLSPGEQYEVEKSIYHRYGKGKIFTSFLELHIRGEGSVAVDENIDPCVSQCYYEFPTASQILLEFLPTTGFHLSSSTCLSSFVLSSSTKCYITFSRDMFLEHQTNNKKLRYFHSL